jgi:hypothetical protein
MIDLYDYSLPAIFFAGLAVILIVGETGWRLGLRGGRGGSQVATLESAVLGLLALIIGFTFAMVLTRFEARRDAVLNEANAITTTALRARLLPEPHKAEALKLLKEYVQVRIDIARSDRSLIDGQDAVARSNAIQEALWQQVKAIATVDRSPIPTGLYIQSLNEMFDNQAKRLSVLRNHVPNMVLLAVYVLAAVGCGFASYASALEQKRTRLPVLIMCILISGVVYVIFDLDRPSGGLIRNSQQPIIDAAAQIAAFPD